MAKTWTIIDETGLKFINFTSMLDFELRDSGKVMAVPVERGGFADYNKVNDPAEITATLAMELDDQAAVLECLYLLSHFKNSAELVHFSLPEIMYFDFTLESYDYKRSESEGALYVTCHFVEVVQVETQAGTTNYTVPKCKDPTSASTQDIGLVNTEPYNAIGGDKVRNPEFIKQ
jgi:hypothetical protein